MYYAYFVQDLDSNCVIGSDDRRHADTLAERSGDPGAGDLPVSVTR